MASPCMKFSLFLLTLFSSLHITLARENHFFNKIPTTTTTSQQEQQQPNFLPQNEESYGLYGHESGQNPPSITTTDQFKQPTNKYLPKNYNPVAYVTVPEDANDATTFSDERTFTNNPNNQNNYYDTAQNYYNNNQQQLYEDAEFRNYPSTSNENINNYYNGGGGSSFNARPRVVDSFQPQGMSDTRYMENGKYFYDINSEKYSTNHPYEALRASRFQNQNQNDFSNKNSYANNGYEFISDNSMGGYRNRPQEFHDEENMP